jgi:hypothetical protein
MSAKAAGTHPAAANADTGSNVSNPLASLSFMGGARGLDVSG